MTILELLAPARNTDIGIAAIDCGADAVYMAGADHITPNSFHHHESNIITCHNIPTLCSFLQNSKCTCLISI